MGFVRTRPNLSSALWLLLLFLGGEESNRYGWNLLGVCGTKINIAAAETVYLETPQVLWNKTFPETDGSVPPGIRRNNVVQISPDDLVVYATFSDGTLHMLDPGTGGVLGSHLVEPWAEGWSVDCISGVNFHISEQEQFLVYSIVDIPPQGSGNVPQSRVISLSHPSGERNWLSSQIPGKISGTPVISSDGFFIFITRNTQDDTVGHFTILSQREDGKVKFDEASNLKDKKFEAPYGPPGIAHRPERGLYDGGLENNEDFIIWSDSTDFGRADDGLTRGFQFPVGFGGIDFDNLETIKLRSIGWTSTTKPVFSKDGLSVYFTATRAAVRAWIKQDFGGPTSWKADLSRKKNDGLQPLYSSVAVSGDEAFLFVGTANASFVSISATSGVTQWEEPTGSIILTQPVVSPNDERVYFIETNGGNVVAKGTKEGNTIWSMSCSDYLNADVCEFVTVEGDFSLSLDGHNIYFGNAMGTVTALSLVDVPLRSPTSHPEVSTSPTVATAPSKYAPSPVVTSQPVSTKPTLDPTEVPTPSPSKYPTVEPTLNPIPISTVSPTDEPIKSLQPTAMPIKAMVQEDASSARAWLASCPFPLVILSFLSIFAFC